MVVPVDYTSPAMYDYAFLALLFLVAEGLSPQATQQLTWVNGDHPDQTMEWTRQPEGGWAMQINGRDFGIFHHQGEQVFHHRGVDAPSQFAVSELVERFASTASRIVLRGQFAGRELAVERTRGGPRLRDPSRTLIRTTLTLRTR